MSADQIGYKKPPLKGQFKKGQSGNPKGKPKGSKSIKATFEEVLRQSVRIRQGDRQMLLTRQHAMFMAMTNKAMQGDTKAYELVLKTVDKLQMLVPIATGTAPDGSISSGTVWTEEDESLRPFLDHMARGHRMSEAGEIKSLDQSDGPEEGEVGKS
jgi:Family of unknown function (DUF5681)